MPGEDSRAKGGSPWIAHGTALLWTAFVVVCLLLPGTVIQPVDEGFLSLLPSEIDKLVHGLLFFFETFYLLRSFRHLRPGLPALPAAIAAALFLGALTEILQLWVPHRDGSGADWIADALGAFACGAWVSRPDRTGTRSTS